ncbi:MAG: ferrous iron transport protein A [Candidatus Faecivicinus sp.]
MAKTGIALKSLANGQSGIVERIELTGATKRRLIEMGITPGTKLTVLKRAPLGDPIEILLRGYSLTLRGTDADRVFVSEVGK